MTVEECDAKGIKTYADNDGGLWYYGEHGREKVIEDGTRNNSTGEA